jgi:class 3 adenylate cyclase
MNTIVDPSRLTMTEIIRLQTVLSQELTRRFERSLALAFSDVVDSTAYCAQFGDAAGRRLQQLHLDLLERCLSHGGGRIVDTAGDGAFTCFASSRQAASAMTALQNLVSMENVNRPRPHQLSLRIGMHWGSVLSDDVQVTGDAVNLCARLAAAAAPAQICVSREFFQELGQDQRRLCRPLGRVALKGIARAVEAMALQWRDPALFPGLVVVRETGERIVLPGHDSVSFGRGESQDGAPAVDVRITLPDALACKQISRRHFELRSRADGYALAALSMQETVVDGIAIARDREVRLRPGSWVRLADVVTLDFLSPQFTGESAIDETLRGQGASPAPTR